MSAALRCARATPADSGAEEADAIAIVAETDRVYKSAPPIVTVDCVAGDVMAVHVACGSVRGVCKPGADVPGFIAEPADVVVWNPWSTKAVKMADFAPTEFEDMICVEPGFVAAHRALPAGGCWLLSQTLQLA